MKNEKLVSELARALRGYVRSYNNKDYQKTRDYQQAARKVWRDYWVEWAASQGVGCKARVELSLRTEFRDKPARIQLGMITLWNSKGALKNTIWMNKISIIKAGNLGFRYASYQIRSDLSMLEDFGTRFREHANGIGPIVEAIGVK